MRPIALFFVLLPTSAGAFCSDFSSVGNPDYLFERVKYLSCVVAELQRDNRNLSNLLDAERSTNLAQTRRIETLALAIAALRLGIEK